ncbi:MAG: hypothetical protein KBF93_08405 [Leptospiraceae bacterium]|nr:hypothetical protein [Leptospiraceae bacterium]
MQLVVFSFLFQCPRVYKDKKQNMTGVKALDLHKSDKYTTKFHFYNQAGSEQEATSSRGFEVDTLC